MLLKIIPTVLNGLYVTPIAALLNISHGAGVLLGDADFNIQVELYLN